MGGKGVELVAERPPRGYLDMDELLISLQLFHKYIVSL